MKACAHSGVTRQSIFRDGGKRGARSAYAGGERLPHVLKGVDGHDLMPAERREHGTLDLIKVIGCGDQHQLDFAQDSLRVKMAQRQTNFLEIPMEDEDDR